MAPGVCGCVWRVTDAACVVRVRVQPPDGASLMEAALIGDRLPGLLAEVSAAGAGEVRAMTADEVAVLARSAYDPGAAGALADLVAQQGRSGLPWSDAGPSAQREEWGALIHGGHVSLSWQMQAAPPSLVTSAVLNPLLRPHPMVPMKRVTLFYRP